MRLFFTLLLTLITALVLALALLWYGLTATDPTATPGQRLEGDALVDVQTLLQRPADGHISLSQSELNQLLRYSIQQAGYGARTAVRARLADGHGLLRLAWNSRWPLRPWINAELALAANGREIIPGAMRIGEVVIPAAVTRALAPHVWETLKQRPEVQPLITGYAAVDAVRLEPRRLTIDYRMDPALAAELQSQQVRMLFGASVTELLPLYRTALEETLADSGRRLSLVDALQPLFSLAAARSEEGADAVVENKALILSLALHAAPGELLALLGLDRDAMPQRPLQFTLEGQHDLARHFLTTAAITAFTDGELAELIGLYKELQDQQGASGFGIGDLVANRAGKLFADIATDPARAAGFQRAMAANESEAWFMPSTRAISRELESQLLERAAAGDEASLMETIDRDIGALVRDTPAYRQ